MINIILELKMNKKQKKNKLSLMALSQVIFEQKLTKADKFKILLFEKFQYSHVFYPCFCLSHGIKNFSSKPLSSQQEQFVEAF